MIDVRDVTSARIVLSGLVSTLLAAAVIAAPAHRVVTVQILSINDFHGALEPPAGANGRIGDVAAGGAVYLAAHLARDVAANSNSIIVGAGDLIGASPLLSSLVHNEPTIESLNAMHLAVSAVGNHEFDRGWQELLRMQRGGCQPVDGCQGARQFTGATFTYLAGNVRRKTPGGEEALFPGTAIRTVGGVKIGFIGETLGATAHLLSGAASKDLEFLDEASTANRLASSLTQQGVHAIVLLLHQGGAQKPDDSDVDGCVGFSGGIVPIVARLSSDIRVVLSGHTHRVYNCTLQGHLVTSAASLGRVITRVDLAIDASTDSITAATARNEIVTRDVPADPVQVELIRRYARLAAPIANRPVGALAGPIVRDVNSAGEGSLGDVIADAELAAGRPLGAQIAFMNEGGIRADLVSASITYNDVFLVQPFGNTLLVMTVDGRTLKDLLERQFDNPRPGARRILQVSSGFSYRYTANAPAGQHVDAASMMLDGRHIELGDHLRIVASDFLYTGGDGMSEFSRSTDIVSVGPDVDALANYVRAHSPLTAPTPNRITRIDASR